MSLPTIKLLAALAVLTAALLGGWIPLRLGAGKGRSRQALRWGNSLAAGIFLGTGLILIEPEARELWNELGWAFPMAPVLTAAGFLGLLFLEHVVFSEAAHAAVHAHAGEPLHGHEARSLVQGRLPYALLIALSVHSLIAGLALGAQQHVETIWLILAGIVAHKASDAVVLGLSVVRSGASPARGRRILGVFALVTPLGIALGAVSHRLVESANVRLLDAVFLSLTAGTFVYIGAMDLLQDEKLESGNRLAQWLLAAGGLLATAAASVVL